MAPKPKRGKKSSSKDDSRILIGTTALHARYLVGEEFTRLNSKLEPTQLPNDKFQMSKIFLGQEISLKRQFEDLDGVAQVVIKTDSMLGTIQEIPPAYGVGPRTSVLRISPTPETLSFSMVEWDLTSIRASNDLLPRYDPRRYLEMDISSWPPKASPGDQVCAKYSWDISTYENLEDPIVKRSYTRYVIRKVQGDHIWVLVIRALSRRGITTFACEVRFLPGEGFLVPPYYYENKELFRGDPFRSKLMAGIDHKRFLYGGYRVVEAPSPNVTSSSPNKALGGDGIVGAYYANSGVFELFNEEKKKVINDKFKCVKYDDPEKGVFRKIVPRDDPHEPNSSLTDPSANSSVKASVTMKNVDGMKKVFVSAFPVTNVLRGTDEVPPKEPAMLRYGQRPKDASGCENSGKIWVNPNDLNRDLFQDGHIPTAWPQLENETEGPDMQTFQGLRARRDSGLFDLDNESPRLEALAKHEIETYVQRKFSKECKRFAKLTVSPQTRVNKRKQTKPVKFGKANPLFGKANRVVRLCGTCHKSSHAKPQSCPGPRPILGCECGSSTHTKYECPLEMPRPSVSKPQSLLGQHLLHGAKPKVPAGPTHSQAGPTHSEAGPTPRQATATAQVEEGTHDPWMGHISQPNASCELSISDTSMKSASPVGSEFHPPSTPDQF